MKVRVQSLTEALAKRLLADRRASDPAAERVAGRIIADVRRRGDAALFGWSQRLDGVRLNPKNVWVSASEFRAAERQVPRDLLNAADHAARNIRAVARRQRPGEWSFSPESGVQVRQRVLPIVAVGCYLPGGRFPLVSTLLMTVIPAQEAGVENIIVACAKPAAALLAVAARLGIRRVARIGGAQAIAAMAYGTESVPRADKIAGPGNRFVTAAKRLISSDCAIDMLAGPTEALAFAQEGRADFIAADLIAQAEHDPDAVSLFVTASPPLAREVAAEMAAQLQALRPSNLAARSMRRNGGILLAHNVEDAIAFINRFAPEHLTLAGDAARLLPKFVSAGSIFLGDWSTQSAGDYATGTNHVLPTGGAARTRGGLSTADFMKCVTVQKLSRSGMRSLGPVIRSFAAAEGLEAHGLSAAVRL